MQQTAENPDYKQGNQEVQTVPPSTSVFGAEQQRGTGFRDEHYPLYHFWPVGVIVVQLTELQLRDRQLRFITLP